MNLTVNEIAKAVGAKNDVSQWGEQVIVGAEFDSRKLRENTLFVPLKGERDGHEFIDSAKEKGAVATLWSQKNELPSDVAVILVDDVLKAFQDLAVYYLEKHRPIVVGITGSNGKTTTKDMTAAVLATTFKTHKTQGNYNNEIGVPYTILTMPEHTEVAVLEMGMDHPGDIHTLSMIGKPDIGVVTLIGESHIEYFGTRENIAVGKMQMVDGVKEKGLVIAPADEPLIVPILEKVTQEKVLFGDEASADIFVSVTEEAKNHVRFTLSFLSGEFQLPVPGKYNAKNALLAAYIANRLGVSTKNIRESLAKVELTRNRTEWKTAKNGAEILSDVYNANPTAMGLVLDAFVKMPVQNDGKRIAVLGDMLELGEAAHSMHEAMAVHLSPETIERVFLYGSDMGSLAKALEKVYPMGSLFYYEKEEKRELIKELKQTVAPNDLVVLKASNGMGLAEVVDSLINE